MTTPNAADLDAPTRRRWFPAPVLSAAIFCVWLLLNNTLFIGHVLLAVALAWGIPLVTLGRDAPPMSMRKPRVFARLMAIVLWDIVVSNVQVARRVLGPESAINPQFLWVPVALESDLGRLWLAGIITMTPGTVSALFSDDRKYLLVHTFDVDEPTHVVSGIKQRYEQPLKEVFG